MDLFKPVVLYLHPGSRTPTKIHFPNLRSALISVMHDIELSDRHHTLIFGTEGCLGPEEIERCYADLQVGAHVFANA